MASIGMMVKRCAGLVDTGDVNDWENDFLENVIERSDNGEDTTKLTSKQVEVLERIFKKHFGD